MVASHRELIIKLGEHPIFRVVSVKALNPNANHRFLFTVNVGSDAEFQVLLAKIREEAVVATRVLREPLRRTWQSAHARKLVTLDFEGYMKQEGFAHLL